MRDQGHPTLVFHERAGTPEEVAANRERLRRTCEELLSELVGHPMHVTLDWPDKERWMKNDA